MLHFRGTTWLKKKKAELVKVTGMCHTDPQGFVNCPARTARCQQHLGMLCLRTAPLALANLEEEGVSQTKGRPAVNKQPLHSRNHTDHLGCNPCPPHRPVAPAGTGSLLLRSLRNAAPRVPLGSCPLFLPGRALLTLAQPREHLREPIGPMAAGSGDTGRSARSGTCCSLFLQARAAALGPPHTPGAASPSHEPALAPRWKGQDLSGTGRGSRLRAGEGRGHWRHPGIRAPDAPRREAAPPSCERSCLGSTQDVLSSRIRTKICAFAELHRRGAAESRSCLRRACKMESSSLLRLFATSQAGCSCALTPLLLHPNSPTPKIWQTRHSSPSPPGWLWGDTPDTQLPTAD